MGLLQAIFASPVKLPEPHTQRPAIRSASLEEMLGLIGLADQMPRMKAGNIYTFPLRAPAPGDTRQFRPYIQMDVGRTDRVIRVNIHDFAHHSSLHVDIRQNPETELFYLDRLESATPPRGRERGLRAFAGIDHTHLRLSCEVGGCREKTLREALGLVRMAVTWIKAGTLDDLGNTHRRLALLAGQAGANPAPSPR